MDIDGARILVTGGTRGIGLELARQLRARGAKVAICGRHATVLESAASEIECLGICADVADESQVDRLIQETIEGLGGLDAVVNNAAIGTFGRLVETDAGDFERVWRVNVLGAFLVARAAARHFVEQDHGTLLNVGSTAARKGFEGGSAYSSSKFALSGLTECWRAELRRHNVRVMQVNPSEVQTGFGGMGERPHNPTKLQAEDVAQMMVDMLALPDRGFITESTLWATNPQ